VTIGAEPPRIEAIMAALINELAAIPEEFTFVLDDYYVIDSDLARQRSGWTRRAASSTAGGPSRSLAQAFAHVRCAGWVAPVSPKTSSSDSPAPLRR
jgi:hypothetical protein